VDNDTLARWNAAAPRYTSYPTAPVWRKDFPDAALVAALRAVQGPTSVYVHVPFCREQCWFCGCNMVVAGRQDAGDRYLDSLERQIAWLPTAPQLPAARIHLGGGTPTWLTIPQLHRLYGLLDRRFTRLPGAELSVEVDPDVTSDEQVEALAGIGVTRLSLGVQSFDPVVLEAINRPQDPERIHRILGHARALGMRGLNLDLVYGLPHQTPASLEDTLDHVVAANPDRLALYSFAYVPWLKKHQQKLDAAAMPDPVGKMELFLLARKRLRAAGYVEIGMDHFARPDDELSVAQAEGRLHRNFMGYTTHADLELVGLGPSAISELAGVYAQQHAGLGRWYRAVADGGPIVEKGWVLTAEDRLRRDVISRLMCNFVVPFEAVERRHGVLFAQHFSRELRSLGPLVDDGLVELHADRLQVTELGRLLVRNVAMAFDAYLPAQSESPRFSKAV
jgi:oxygen-independent coproporphyrinogen-3 oxidase